MTQENELGELVGYPTRESELQSNNLTNIGLVNLKADNPTPNLTPDTTPTKNPASDQNPPIKNPNPASNQNPASDDPTKNPVSNPTKKAPLLFVELRKLRKPGKGIQITYYKDVQYRTYQKGDSFQGQIVLEIDLNTQKERNGEISQVVGVIARALVVVKE